jgi:hypothetical protein
MTGYRDRFYMDRMGDSTIGQGQIPMQKWTEGEIPQ